LFFFQGLHKKKINKKPLWVLLVASLYLNQISLIKSRNLTIYLKQFSLQNGITFIQIRDFRLNTIGHGSRQRRDPEVFEGGAVKQREGAVTIKIQYLGEKSLENSMKSISKEGEDAPTAPR
jgi:hypothetical protein